MPAAAGMTAMIAFWPYRLERLTSFVNIWADPAGKGYHAIQSLVSFASGGLTGRGLGNGIQKHGYLPEARSDFIFSVIGEELGLLGVVAVIGLFAVILWQGRKIMLASPDPLGRLLAFGVTWLLGLQAAMNIAVVTVSVPTKGIALPFVSAGGSGLLLLGAAIGILLNVARQTREPACPVAR
jgi:cell division protein FtsW